MSLTTRLRNIGVGNVFPQGFVLSWLSAVSGLALMSAGATYSDKYSWHWLALPDQTDCVGLPRTRLVIAKGDHTFVCVNIIRASRLTGCRYL